MISFEMFTDKKFFIHGHINSPVISHNQVSNVQAVQVDNDELQWVLDVFPHLNNTMAYFPRGSESDLSRVQVWYGDEAKRIAYYWAQAFPVKK